MSTPNYAYRGGGAGGVICAYGADRGPEREIHRQALCEAEMKVRPARRRLAAKAAERQPQKKPEAAASRRLFKESDWPALARALRLSPRQLEIAELICEELTYAAIASRLGISINTVRMHIRGLFEKLGVQDRVGVVLRLALTQRRLARGKHYFGDPT